MYIKEKHVSGVRNEHDSAIVSTKKQAISMKDTKIEIQMSWLDGLYI